MRREEKKLESDINFEVNNLITKQLETMAKMQNRLNLVAKIDLAKLEEKNKKVEELQKLNEEKQQTIDSLIEEKKELVGVLRERLGEKETESVLAQSEVKKLEREIAESRARQEWASINIKDKEIRKNKIRKIDLAVSKSDNLLNRSEALELAAHQKTTSLEIAVSRCFDLALELENVQRQLSDVESLMKELNQQRNNLLVGMQDFGVAVLNEEIYIIGGYFKDGSQQDCYKLKDDGSWMQLASLNKKREGISSSSLVYKGDIWVIGGYSADYCLNSVEKYDISQDK